MMKKGIVVLFTFHKLDQMALVAEVRSEKIYLSSNINWSDRHHELAAILLAKKSQKQVIWQDISGRKHFVNARTKPGNTFSSLDPRCRAGKHLQLAIS
jgi:hypothetical protein